MDPVGAVVGVAAAAVQGWVQSKLTWLILLPLSGIAWLIPTAWSTHLDILSLIRSGCDWLDLPMPIALEHTAGWLRAPEREEVAVLAALTAGVLASLSGRGSVLGNGRGGQIAWVLLALSCLALDVHIAVWLAVKAAIVVLAVVWAFAWLNRIPSRTEPTGSLEFLNPGDVVARWALGMFETGMLLPLPVFMVIGEFYRAFSSPIWRPEPLKVAAAEDSPQSSNPQVQTHQPQLRKSYRLGR